MRVPKWLKKLFGDNSYWLSPYEEWGFRRGLAESIRWVADRIGSEDAYSRAGSAFAYRVGAGRVDYFEGPVKPRQEPRFGTIGKKPGVELWYRVSDYNKHSWEER